MSPSPLTSKPAFILTLGFLTTTAALTVDLSLPAIPAMASALLTDLPTAQKIVGIFMLGMALGQIPAGLFSDRLGRLPVLYVGMSVFTLAATLASFAQSIEVMLAARFVQGIGAAAAVVLSRAIVRDIASGKEGVRLMSLMAMLFTAAPVIAPSLGALLMHWFDWRSTFTGIVVAGILLLLAIRVNLVETHTPERQGHPARQLLDSVRTFFSFRRSIFGLLLIVTPPIGFMSVITVSAALIIEEYGLSARDYGFVFATAGLSIMLGSWLNRQMVSRFEVGTLIGIGASLMFAASISLLVICVLNTAPLWWFWGSLCVYFVAVGILAPNATVIALDPLPKVAGVASSIIGSIQNALGAFGAILGAALYDGSLRNAGITVAATGVITFAIFLLRPLIAPTPSCAHPPETLRDRNPPVR
ncbi:MAG: multidrug effflux MFS transporter [Pseudomonadota bacterium]